MGHRDNDLLLPCFANRWLQQRHRPLSLSHALSVYTVTHYSHNTTLQQLNNRQSNIALSHIYTNMTFGLFTHIAPGGGSLEHIHICVPSSRSGRLPPSLQSSSRVPSGGTCFPTLLTTINATRTHRDEENSKQYLDSQ